jgi:dTDP-4-amino-4,6-dideoxygalactose transaminase
VDARIPFNKPFIVGKELHYIARAVALGNISGDGHFTQQCSRFLEERFGIHRVLMVPSCTAALEMAAMLCGLGPGDEVILPSFTFVSTANAVVRLGARPIFVDIRPDTLNLDETLIEAAITPRTKAIMPVHYAGVGCAMDRIMAIAKGYGLRVIEDAAQAVNSWFDRRALGSMGDLGTYSFHETKNYICGEGGAVHQRPVAGRAAEIIRDKGTNQQFFRGQVDKYTWVDVGSSYVPSESVCVPVRPARDDGRHQRAAAYPLPLLPGTPGPLESEGLLRLPYLPEDCQGNYHLFYILLPDGVSRDALLNHLNASGIHAVFHYVPLHSSPMGQTFGCTERDLPVTEAVSSRLLRLPFFYEITQAEQARVVAGIARFFHQTGSRSIDRTPATVPQ